MNGEVEFVTVKKQFHAIEFIQWFLIKSMKKQYDLKRKPPKIN